MVAAKEVTLFSDTLYIYAMAAIGCREVYMYRNMLIQKKNAMQCTVSILYTLVSN